MTECFVRARVVGPGGIEHAFEGKYIVQGPNHEMIYELTAVTTTTTMYTCMCFKLEQGRIAVARLIITDTLVLSDGKTEEIAEAIDTINVPELLISNQQKIIQLTSDEPEEEEEGPIRRRKQQRTEEEDW